MSIYMTLSTPDGDGNQAPAGFFHTDITKKEDIPADAIEIDQAQFEQLSGGQASRRWRDGQVVAFAPSVDLAAAVAARQKQLNIELGAYIYGQYDAGTQASMQALYSQDGTAAAIKSDIAAVWDWIATIMAYYYQCKTAIGAQKNAEDVAAYAWEFNQFDKTQPAVTLAGIFEAL